MRKLKLFLTTMIMIIGIICVVGCSSDSQSEATTEEYFADDDFMAALSQGLEDRWSLDDGSEYEYYTDEHKEIYTKYVNAELDKVEDFTTKKFKDTTLQEKAIKYINALKAQKEALDYVTVDPEQYEEKWGTAYNERSKLITEFVNNYNLTVSDDYANTLKEFEINAKEVEQNEEIKESIQEMLASVEFQAERDEYSDWVTYTGVIENTAGVDFNSFEININLLDKDGMIVESLFDSISNLKKGQKAKIEFSTDQEFKTTSLEINYWD